MAGVCSKCFGLVFQPFISAVKCACAYRKEPAQTHGVAFAARISYSPAATVSVNCLQLPALLNIAQEMLHFAICPTIQDAVTFAVLCRSCSPHLIF